MRHPQANRLRQQCRELLPQVLRSVGLRADQPFELDTEGWVNVCFLGRDVVVRFNARDPELPKFDREEWAYRVLADRGFPVPRVVARVDNPRLCPYPVLITHRIQGQNLEATWDTLDAAQEESLAAQAGQWLARLHQQKMAAFGEVYRPEHVSQAELWGELSMDWLVACTDIFDAADLERFRRTMETAQERAKAPPHAVLVHRDYHFGNLLHDGRSIVGILDFEWALASDPLIDLVALPKIEAQCPGALESVVRGYRDEAGADPQDDPVAESLYAVAQSLELCDVAARFLSQEQFERHRAAALGALVRLERLL